MEDVAVEICACWNQIGVQGDATCPELPKVVHCRNCPVYAAGGRALLTDFYLANLAAKHSAKLATLDTGIKHPAVAFVS